MAPEQQQRSSRRRALLLGLLLVVAGVVGFLSWGLSDGPAVDDAELLPAVSSALATSDAYTLLRRVADESERLEVSGRPVATLLRREDVAVDPNGVAEIRALPLVRALPSRIEEVLRAPGLRPREDLVDPWRGVFTMAQLLRVRIQQDLASLQPTEALRTLQAGLRLSARLHDEAVSVSQLAVASRVYAMSSRALLSGISSRAWSVEDLRMLLAVESPKQTASSVLAALRASYRSLLDEAGQVSRQALLAQYAYHPNRSRAWWSNAMGAAVLALERGDVVQAYTKAIELPAFESLLGRNVIGAQLFPTVARTLLTDMAWALELPARFQQQRLVCALAIHGRERQTRADTLVELVPAILSSLPVDPWSGQPFRYVADEGLVYSIGANRKDERGRYDPTAAKAGESDDFGMRVGW